MYIIIECADMKTRQLYCCFKRVKRRVTHISSFLMRIFVLLIFLFLFTFFDLIWWFIIMRYFHIETSAIQRKYPTLIVPIFLFQRAQIPSIEIHSYLNIFRSQAKCPEVSMAWNTPCRLQNSPYFCVFKYARAVKQKFWNEAEDRERD